jgi:hypothetical protein
MEQEYCLSCVLNHSLFFLLIWAWFGYMDKSYAFQRNSFCISALLLYVSYDRFAVHLLYRMAIGHHAYRTYLLFTVLEPQPSVLLYHLGYIIMLASTGSSGFAEDLVLWILFLDQARTLMIILKEIAKNTKYSKSQYWSVITSFFSLMAFIHWILETTSIWAILMDPNSKHPWTKNGALIIGCVDTFLVAHYVFHLFSKYKYRNRE